MGKCFKLFKLPVLLLVFVLFAGCGDKKDDSNSTNDTTVNKPDDEVSGNNDRNTTAGDQQGDQKTGENELGMKDGLPPDFPSYVPQPPEGKVIGFLTSSEGTNVSFESPKSIAELADFYKGELQKSGYKVKPDGEAVSESSAMIDWEKEGKTVSLVVVKGQNDNSSIVITYK